MQRTRCGCWPLTCTDRSRRPQRPALTSRFCITLLVGIDGSGHSQRTLEWAMKEAAVRHAPLTVLTVHPAIAGYYGGVVTYPDDLARAEEAREAAQAESGKVLAGLDGPPPESVTVKAVHGFTVEDPQGGQRRRQIVLGSRGAGGFTRLVTGSTTFQVAQHAPCPVIIVRPRDRGGG